MIKGFKEFISQGNVVDLAVGVVVGAAFGAVVTSFTNDVLMGLIGAIGFSQDIPRVLRPDLTVAYTDTDGDGQRGDRSEILCLRSAFTFGQPEIADTARALRQRLGQALDRRRQM